MIYFDAAATTLQKPEVVHRAMTSAMQTMSSPGRGGYRSAQKAAETVLRCRMELGEMFGVAQPEQVIFTSSATHSLNIAIRSLVAPGSRVVVSGYEHNAVTRPLHTIEGVRIHVVNTPLFDHAAMLRGFDELITRDTAAVICTHVSNVFGYILPIEEIARLCRERGVPLIVDASQSAGTLAIDQQALGAAFIAFPGHKGLYGPQGTGVLLCGGAAQPLLQGGTGSNSKDQQMPDFLPDRLEAGTHNVPGIAGLRAGAAFVRKVGTGRIAAHARALKERLCSRLEGDGRYRIFCSHDPALQVGVMSFQPAHTDAETLCGLLDERGIALRCGFHCAPFAHQSAGTLHSGTVRFSPSVFNQEREVDALARVLKNL